MCICVVCQRESGGGSTFCASCGEKYISSVNKSCGCTTSIEATSLDSVQEAINLGVKLLDSEGKK